MLYVSWQQLYPSLPFCDLSAHQTSRMLLSLRIFESALSPNPELKDVSAKSSVTLEYRSLNGNKIGHKLDSLEEERRAQLQSEDSALPHQLARHRATDHNMV